MDHNLTSTDGCSEDPYLMTACDPHRKPLLASHDPDEPPREGGLLVARYEKGPYVYTGYAFLRQLPAGVPGAVRLFANLLSAEASPTGSGARNVHPHGE